MMDAGLIPDVKHKVKKSDARFILALEVMSGTNRTLRSISNYLNLEYTYCSMRLTGLVSKGIITRFKRRKRSYFTKPMGGFVFSAIRDYYKVKNTVAVTNVKMFLERFRKENEL